MKTLRLLKPYALKMPGQTIEISEDRQRQIDFMLANGMAEEVAPTEREKIEKLPTKTPEKIETKAPPVKRIKKQ